MMIIYVSIVYTVAGLSLKLTSKFNLTAKDLAHLKQTQKLFFPSLEVCEPNPNFLQCKKLIALELGTSGFCFGNIDKKWMLLIHFCLTITHISVYNCFNFHIVLIFSFFVVLFGNGMSSATTYESTSSGHMCDMDRCVERTSLSIRNFGRRFYGCQHWTLVSIS